jgi:hypothetical protein
MRHAGAIDRLVGADLPFGDFDDERTGHAYIVYGVPAHLDAAIHCEFIGRDVTGDGLDRRLWPRPVQSDRVCLELRG